METCDRHNLINISNLRYVHKVGNQLSQRTWSSDAAKLGLPVAAGIQLGAVLLTIFVNRFIIFRTGGELCPGLFVVR
jgi:hypothetical protein